MQVNSNSLFYLDRNKNVQVDDNSGILSTVQGKVASIFGQRNYNILDVLNRALTSDKKLTDHTIKIICDKTGRKLGLTQEKADQISKLILLSKSKQKCETTLHETSSMCLKDSKMTKSMELLQKHLTPNSEAQKILSSLLEETSLKAKMNGVKLSPELINTYLEDYKFLFKTRLIYSILGYQNSTYSGRKEHSIIERTDERTGKSSLYIKKQGKWTSVKEIRDNFDWDKKEGMLASKDNANERWNYFGEGLVPIDRFYHHEAANQTNYPKDNAKLHPVAKLSKNEMSQLLKHAKKFQGFNNENNPTKESEPLNCVIQMISNPRPLFKHGALQNLNGQIPLHCGIRIITSDGLVYSTGFGSTLAEDKYNTGGSKYLGTINGQPTIMDYEEFRTHDGRVVTTIATTTARAENTLNLLNAYREGSIRFNIFKQNCIRLGMFVLGLNGVTLNIKVALNTVISRIFPSIEQVPIIGAPIKNFLRMTKKVRREIRSEIPQIVKDTFQALQSMVLFVPTKISTLLKNLFILSFGGRIGSPIRKNEKLEDFEKDDKALTNFDELVSNLFDDTASDVQHSSVFVNWQLKQKSTVVHKYSGQPNMNILPPVRRADVKYSDTRKAQFAEIYKASTPIDSDD